jgi:hypothetical protein
MEQKVWQMIHSISFAMIQDPNYTMTLMVEAKQSEAMAGMIEAWKAQFRAKTNVDKEY